MLARHATAAQLERILRGYRGAASAALGTSNRAHAQRFLTWSWDDDGSLALRGRLPPEDGALVVAALETARAGLDAEHDAHVPAETPRTRRPTTDAAVVPMLESGGRPLSVVRRTRSIPPAIRRALRRRDHGCRFPGCTQQRFVDAHHIDHWAHGGETKLSNLVLLCRHHHRLLHDGGYRLERRRATTSCSAAPTDTRCPPTHDPGAATTTHPPAATATPA